LSVNLVSGWQSCTLAAVAASSRLVLGPVATARVSDLIAERLSTAMRDGTLNPGDRLPTEAELAREFKVGRTSVREALQKLRALGLVETRKGLGAFVTEPVAGDPLADFARWTASDPAAIEQLVEARVALETLAAALAALRATDEEVVALEHLHIAHAEAADAAALVATDQAFHAAIMAASRNRFVQGAYEVLIDELTDFRRKTLALPWAGDRSIKGHEAIVTAIRDRAPAAARDAMAEHLWVLYAEIEEAAAAEGRPPGLPLLPRDAIS
jgi:GntR family transcriptional regulator, transcriptional repressor for pyruvate dehydrogenase complex